MAEFPAPADGIVLTHFSLVHDGLIAGHEGRLSLPGPVRPHHQEYFR